MVLEPAIQAKQNIFGYKVIELGGAASLKASVI